MAAALIKSQPDLCQALKKGRLKKRQENTAQVKETRKEETEDGEKFTVPFGHGLCWTLINGYCSP